MKKFLLLFFLGPFFFNKSNAQFTRYVVVLKHKGATTFTLANPSAYLSQRAIARRTRYNIAIDSSDLPVPAAYVNQIDNIPNVTILNASRWLNAVTIQTNDAGAITAINALPFVQATTGVAARPIDAGKKYEEPEDIAPPALARVTDIQSDFYNYGTAAYNEIHLHQGEFLHNVGLRGQGMQIAILDGGFFNYTGLKAFDSVNANGQVLSTWDFVDRQVSVTEDHPHGMTCFSVIAANIPGEFVGKAPKASFHLFRTEDTFSEFPIEEFNWACGAERADSAGSDIISSSLGYGYDFNTPVPDYPQSILNGDITMSARAADLAAKKGILVFNAAGNTGTDPWHTILTPADADSIIAVGAVSATGQVGSFSAYGPSADGRIKPELASVGVAAMIQTAGNTVGFSNGTSYACPNLAGLGTCLWQGFPEFNNMRIIQALKASGSKYTNPDNRVGYGIPNLREAFVSLLKEYANASAQITNCNVVLNWNSKDMSAMRYEIEKKEAGDAQFVKIATINANTNSAILSNRSYQYSIPVSFDINTSISYRIRQVVDTTTATLTSLYIDTVSVTLNSFCVGATIDRVYVAPNPVNQSSLIIETAYAVPKMAIHVFDSKGAMVMRISTNKGAGRLSIDLPHDRLAAGVYHVQVFNGENKLGTTSFIKL